MTAHLIGAPGDTGMVLVEHPDRLPTVAWHSGRTVRLDSAAEDARVHGEVMPDRSSTPPAADPA